MTSKNIQRVSEYFHLSRRQPFLDFVDVNLTGDTRLFVDPRALHILPSEWGKECCALVENYFSGVLKAIKSADEIKAKRLLRGLGEPNETHLGLSIGSVARGRGWGEVKAAELYSTLAGSHAVQTGLVQDVSDSILLVPGVGPDLISDLTTNVIREPLIHYTQDACRAYGIPLTPGINSGWMWDPAKSEWYQEEVDLPMVGSDKLILVPKAIVRLRPDYSVDEYYRHYVAVSLQDEEFNANSDLVRILKDGTRRKPSKKSIFKKYGSGKESAARETIRHPDALRRYRDDKKEVSPPLKHHQLSQVPSDDMPNFKELHKSLCATSSGRDDAKKYEDAVEKLLSSLFHPSLTTPRKQAEINEGRKIVDIAYFNMAQDGFFKAVSHQRPSIEIFVECKNYSSDPKNPELDQLAGRFSPQRGQVGILVCREFKDKELFIKRCRDTARDDRGWIIPLDHDDLRILIEERDAIDPGKFPLLVERLRSIVA